jgi:hypothetical protein
MKKLIFDFRDYEYKRIELNKLNFIAPEMWAEVELNCFTGYKNTISYTDHTFQDVVITKELLDASKKHFNDITYDESDKNRSIRSIKTTFLLDIDEYSKVIAEIEGDG